MRWQSDVCLEQPDQIGRDQQLRFLDGPVAWATIGTSVPSDSLHIGSSQSVAGAVPPRQTNGEPESKVTTQGWRFFLRTARIERTA